MAWSIYAYLPFIWLGTIVFYGLIRASYEVGVETPGVLSPETNWPVLYEKKYDLTIIESQRVFSNRGMELMRDPLGAVGMARKSMKEDILREVASCIDYSERRYEHTNRNYFTATLFVGKIRKN